MLLLVSSGKRRARTQEEMSAEKILKAPVEKWQAALETFLAEEVQFGPQFQASLLTVSARATDSLEELVSIMNPKKGRSSNGSFNGRMPSLRDATVADSSKANLFVKVLLSGKMISLIHKGCEGCKKMAVFLEALRAISECADGAQALHPLLQESVEEITDIQQCLVALLSEGAFTQAHVETIDKVMEVKGKSNRALIAKQLRQNPFWKGKETTLRTTVLNNATLLPEVQEAEHGLSEQKVDETILVKVARKLALWQDKLPSQAIAKTESLFKKALQGRLDAIKQAVGKRSECETLFDEMIGVTSEFKKYMVTSMRDYSFYMGLHKDAEALKVKWQEAQLESWCFESLAVVNKDCPLGP